jgi:hypothetical protein
MKFLPLVFLILLGSCIKEMKVNPEFEGSKLVVNALICPDSIIRVHVSTSSAMGQAITHLEDVELTLYENGLEVGVFFYDTLGWYQNVFYPSAGNSYKLVANSPSFGKVEAITSIPFLPENLSGTYYKISDVPISDNGIVKYFETESKSVFLDDPLKENYYELGQNSFLYQQTQEKDPSLLSDGDLSYNPRYYYCSDELFNGQEKTFLLCKGGYVSLSPFGTIFHDENYQRLIKSCSREYYLFRKSWTKHLYNQNSVDVLDDPLQILFYGDPVTMYSNVVGGYGVFAGYSQTKLKMNYVE